jgi:phage replication initiation protein
MGFERSAKIVVGAVDSGVVAWGGEHQKGWIFTSLTGTGCQWVQDWDRAQEAAEGCGEYEAKRVDIALDTFNRSVSLDSTLEAYRAGRFRLPGPGKPPKCIVTKPEQSVDSAIIRIGTRTANKYLRGYEKGKQVLGPKIAHAQRTDPESFDWGDWLTQSMPMMREGRLVSVDIWDWFRLELELKPHMAPLPEDVIDRRDQYFAGAYPYLGEVLSGVDAEPLIMRRQRGPQTDLHLALEQIRIQFGPTIYTALVCFNGDIGRVFQRICAHKHNQHLVKAGVLMVDHSEIAA